MAQKEAAYRRIVTDAERKQEKALAFLIILDLIIVVPYFLVGLAVHSLSMVAEVLRGGLLLFVTCFSLRTMRRSHRGLISEYDYGIGKLERALSGTVAMLLLFAAGYIVWEAFSSKPEKPQSVFLAGLAVIFVCLNLGVNSAPLWPLWRAMREEPSVIVLSHFRARLAKALGSVVVVACVIIHMVSSDPMTGKIAEAIGSLFVVGFMVVVAVSLLREALPDLLDRSLNETMQLQITRTLATFFDDYDDLISVRTRRSGNIAHVEIKLAFSAEKNLGELTEIMNRMQNHLQQAIPNSDILIIPRASATTAQHR